MATGGYFIMAIGSYFTNSYWLLFYYWLLVAILLVDIDDY
jgi:hypothetical protein